MEVKFLNLNKTTERIRRSFLLEVGRLLDKRKYILDENVTEFENSWAKYCRQKFCVGTSSGSDALYLAFRSLGVGMGDEVIVQGNAYNASVVAILRCGARPVFADVTSIFTMHQDEVAKKVTARTKAILVVHLYGLVQPVHQFKDRLHLPVVEDCAQAHGYRPQGDIAAWSFYPTKTLGALGDAGAVTTNDKNLADKMRAIGDLGQTQKNDHQYLGSTMRLDPIQAIVLRLQLKYLDADIHCRKEMAKAYDDFLGQTLTRREYYPYIYPYFTPNRTMLHSDLQTKGIQTQVHYPIPVYRQPFYEFETGPMPNSERWAATELSLPFFIGLTIREQKYVVHSIGA